MRLFTCPACTSWGYWSKVEGVAMSGSVLVTGGAGFIGSHIVDALISAGHDVCTVENFRERR
jgi:hypothetical protein